MEPSIFTKIIWGEIPANRVYEDDKTLAFMTIDPFQPGHVLVVPKVQVDHIDDLPEEDYRAVFKTVQKVAKRIKEVLGVKRAVLLVQGFEVPHAHVHVIPANVADDFNQPIAQRADPEFKAPEPDFPALQAMADRLAF